MSELNQRVEYVDSFRGYNHNLKISDREFWDTKNITADYYPLLSTRQKRYRIKWISNLNEDPGVSDQTVNGLIAHQDLCWVNNNKFIKAGAQQGSDLPMDSSYKRTMVGMGVNVVVFPDKVMFDVVNGGNYKSLENTVTLSGVTVSLTTWDARSKTIPTTQPAANDGALWQDTSVVGSPVLRRYSADAGEWLSVPTFYIKLSGTDIADGFRRYDGVTISGLTDTGLNGSYTLYGASQIGDWILISGSAKAVGVDSGTVTITRSVPDLDFVCEWENRLWGVKKDTNEIYASALGDPRNWGQFAGISTDSYAVNVGSPGNWTGCCVYNGHPMFFKENIIYVIYGTQPSNFQISTIECRGVEEGSEQSLCVVYGSLFYKSPFDICVFNGGYPQDISHELGHVRYKNAVCGALGRKLYVTMKDFNNDPMTFTYDTEYGIWCKEEEFDATYYAAYDGDLFCVAKDLSVANKYFLWSMAGRSEHYVSATWGRLEPDFDWYAETGDIELITPDHEYVSKIQLRIELGDVNDSLRVSVKYDTDPEWVEKYSIQKVNKRNIFIPIIPQRCQRMRIRIEGTGEAKIWTLAKTIEGGSELKNDTI